MKKFFTLFLALMMVMSVGAREGARFPAGSQRSFGKVKLQKHTRDASRKASIRKSDTQTIDVDVAYITDYGQMDDGTYDYFLSIYNSVTEYPVVQFDIYVSNTDDFSGKYSQNAGNLDVEYGNIMFSEEDYDFIDDCEVTITKVGNEYKIEGYALGYFVEDTYKFSVQCNVPVEPAYTYDYEPDEVSTFDFTATKYEVEDYTEEYSLAYLTLSKDNYSLVLEYNTEELKGGKIPAGEYSIDDSEAEGTFNMSVGGDDEYDFGCYLMVMDGDYYNPYYLVSGTVKVSYDESGKMTILVDAKSAKGSTVKVTYEEQDKPTPKPGEGIEIVMEDYQSASFTSEEGIEITTEGGNNPAVYNANSKDLRVYATGKLTIEAGGLTITQIVFDLSAQGLKRQAEITPSTGTMSYDIDNAKVIWTGSATSVTFTVGDKAVYGSESTKAGQFDFTKITVTTDGGSPVPPTPVGEWTAYGKGTCSYVYTAIFEETWTQDGLPIYVMEDSSNPNIKHFKVANWMSDDEFEGVDLFVDYDASTGLCHVPEQYIGYEDPDYGKVYVADFSNYKYSEYSYDDYPCVFDEESGTFELALVYFDKTTNSADDIWSEAYEYIQVDGDSPVPPTPAGDNLIANGSFEEWNNDVQPTNWEGWQISEFANTSSANMEKTTDSYGGNYACIVKGSTSNVRLATGKITLPAGTYAVRFFAKAVDGSAAIKPGYATVQANGSASYNYGEFANEAIELNSKWQEVLYEFTLNEQTEISMVVMNYKNPGADCIIDAYELKAGPATGIRDINSDVAVGAMYNLSGQLVGDDYKGVVILNGKKMLRK